MGGRESTTRKVSFGLDEEEKVTVLQGIKLSEDVLQRMRDPEPTPAPEIKPPKPESRKPDSPGPPPGPSAAQMQEELRRRFEQQQAMVQEELARIARREREAGQENVSASLLRERAKTREEQEKAQSLPAELDAWVKQLDKKEAELQQLSAFYKEQLLLLEKKNMDFYQQAAQQYNQAADKAEAHIKPRHVVPICPGLQSQVLTCYKENKHQTLLCSDLAREYMNCINTAKKNTMVNHG